jgi:alpha-N-arabinofuranosidase
VCSKPKPLADADVYAKNTLNDHDRVKVQPNDTASLVDGRLTVKLPPVSWTAIALGSMSSATR